MSPCQYSVQKHVCISFLCAITTTSLGLSIIYVVLFFCDIDLLFIEYIILPQQPAAPKTLLGHDDSDEPSGTMSVAGEINIVNT